MSFANPGLARERTAYAARGYAVVFIDFHGSPGYGQEFTDSISQHWGDRPFEDLQKGLAATLQKFPWLDGNRACSLGASYGGYMQNWIAGQWPDGFRCIVNHAGIFDTRSMYYTTEELWFTEWENGGPYYKTPEIHERFNPASHVEKWKTPMLVLHGERDYRVPYTQGIATFTALQRLGIESRLVDFPDENHWILKPANSVYCTTRPTGLPPPQPEPRSPAYCRLNCSVVTPVVTTEWCRRRPDVAGPRPNSLGAAR